MARPRLADRVIQTTASQGTGPLTLASAPPHRTFAAAVGVGVQCYYTAEALDDAGHLTGAWEVGEGHLSDATTLVRDRVIESSDGTTPVSFGTGTKRVYCTIPAEAVVPDKTYTHAQSVPAASWTVPHGLGKRPSVTVVDSAGDWVVGGVHYVDADTLRIDFAAAFSGTAECN